MYWQTNKMFNLPFKSTEGWDLTTASNFPKRAVLAADTETKLYYNDKLLSDDEAYELYKANGQQWSKNNIEVRCYAYMLSDGDDFVLFQDCEDFLTACAAFRCDFVFWYNAKFDFAIFDYYMLTHDWHDSTLEVEKFGHQKHKLPDKTYQDLNGDFGQRYSKTIWKAYTANNRHRKVHKFKMLDVCNVLAGGLKNNLESWKIKDHQGNDIRKLDMEYSSADLENDADIQYMINDTKGLYLLAEELDRTMMALTGYSLFKGDYLTAGGLAKKEMLKNMFNRYDDKENIEAFKYVFPMSPELDKDLRLHNLYLGGKCFVNPAYKGVVCNTVYTYDVNSMYPNQLRNMKYPTGKAKKVDEIGDRNKYVYVLAIKNLYGALKPNMVCVWQDKLSDEYVDFIREPELRYIWLDELEEIEHFYYLDYDVEFIWQFEAHTMKGSKTFIDKFYEIKKNNKGAKKQAAKLQLNSSYGKLAQKIERCKATYQLNEDGVVHLVKSEYEVDEKGMLSVLVGSRCTALARVHLMRLMRLSTNNNPAKYFIYCDTDSLKLLVPFDDPNEIDDVELGKLKCEGVFEYGLFLAPKTYILYNEGEYEVHCKGVNTNVVANAVKGKSFAEACEIFKPNITFKCLCGLNVKGGKALIYVDKMLLNDENMKINKEAIKEQMELDDFEGEDNE